MSEERKSLTELLLEVVQTWEKVREEERESFYASLPALDLSPTEERLMETVPARHDFPEVLDALTEGKQFRRLSWDHTVRKHGFIGLNDLDNAHRSPYLYYQDERVDQPYVPSYADLYAADWVEL